MYQLTAAGVGALAFVAALALLHKHIAKKVVPWLMLIAGVGLVGVGLVGRLVGRLADGVTAGLASAGAVLFGASGVALIAAVVIGICLYPHMKPKGQPPTKFTPWLAFFFPAVVFATGGFLADIAVFGTTTFGDVGTAIMATLAEAARGASSS